MTGLDRARAILEGRVPLPPIQALIGFSLVAAEDGSATFELDVRKDHYNPMGTLHGGVLCDIGDAAMGCATMTTLASGESFTTLELKINFFKPVWSGKLQAKAEILKRTRSTAYSECEVRDEDGNLVAKLASTCMVLQGKAAEGR